MFLTFCVICTACEHHFLTGHHLKLHFPQWIYDISFALLVANMLMKSRKETNWVTTLREIQLTNHLSLQLIRMQEKVKALWSLY